MALNPRPLSLDCSKDFGATERGMPLVDNVSINIKQSCRVLAGEVDHGLP